MSRHPGISHRRLRLARMGTTARTAPLRPAAARWPSANTAVDRNRVSTGGPTSQSLMVITAAYTPPAPPAARRSGLWLGALLTLTFLAAVAVSGSLLLIGAWRPGYLGFDAQPANPVTAVADNRSSGAEGVENAPDRTSSRPPRTSRSSAKNPPVSANGYMWPTTGVITQEFGCTDFELEPWNAALGCRFHYGIDIASAAGTPIFAAKAGRILFAGWKDEDGYGYRVEMVDTDGVRTLYAHLCCPPSVWAGQEIRQGEQIGQMGTTGASSGPHLHFAVDVGGVASDPRAYLPEGGPGA